MSELKVHLEEKDGHGLVAEEDEHAEGAELGVALAFRRPQVDDRREHIDELLRLIGSLGLRAGASGRLGPACERPELGSDQEASRHRCQVLEVSLGSERIDPGEVTQVGQVVQLRDCVQVRVVHNDKVFLGLLGGCRHFSFLGRVFLLALGRSTLSLALLSRFQVLHGDLGLFLVPQALGPTRLICTHPRQLCRVLEGTDLDEVRQRRREASLLALASAQVASAASLALAAADGGLNANEVRVEHLDVEVR